MTGVPVRVAVHTGSTAVRVAALEPGGEPYLLADVPGSLTQRRVRALVADLVGGWPAEVVLVRDGGGQGCAGATSLAGCVAGEDWGHPARDVPGGCCDLRSAWVGRGAKVRAVAAAVAAGRSFAPGHDRLVVDAGHSGTVLTVLGQSGCARVRRSPVGGAALDAVVAPLVGMPPGGGSARAIREALSLLPTATVPGGDVSLGADAVRAALTPPLARIVTRARTLIRDLDRPVDVLLIGGVARTPLLAELFDEAGLGSVRVAARPEAAAVLGALSASPPGRTCGAVVALASPSRACGCSGARVNGCNVDDTRADGAPRVGAGVLATCGGSGAHTTGCTLGADPADPADPVDPVDPGRQWVPPPPRRSASPHVLVAAVLGALSAIALLAAPAPASITSPEPGDVVVQYGYAMRLPEGWAHSGGLPERRRTLLTPADAPEGSDLVAVERTSLGYDATAEPLRALQDLRAAFDSAVAAGEALSDFAPATGRTAATYRQRGAAGPIEWYVVLDGPDQLSVGCQHTAAGAAAVARACAVVVGSVRRRS